VIVGEYVSFIFIHIAHTEHFYCFLERSITFIIILDYYTTDMDSSFGMAATDAYLIHTVYYAILLTVSLDNLDM
jgi:hypothetical protein